MARIPKYIRVTNFDQHQHGGEKRKDLPWVKLKVTTLVDLELMALPAPTFKLFICLLLLAQKTDNRVQTECKTLAKTVHMTSGSVQTSVRELLRLGFVEPIPVYTKSRKSLASRAGESRAEEKREEGSTSTTTSARARVPAAANTKNIDEHEFQRLLAAIRDADDGTERVLRKGLAGFPPGAIAGLRERVLENGVRSPAALAVHLVSDPEFRACYGVAA